MASVRSRSGWSIVFGALVATTGCQHDVGEEAGETDFCDTDQIPDGDWDTTPYDWSDANAPGPETNVGPLIGLDPFVLAAGGTAPLAVHAIHMSTGEAMLFHGHQDQFLWDVGELMGTGPDGVPMAFRPLIDQRTWPTLDSGTDCGENSPPSYTEFSTPRYLDLFCAGHAQLYDGTVFLAGGDVTAARVVAG